MNGRQRQILLFFLVFVLYLRAGWSGLSWGLSGHLASSAAKLSAPQPPLPSWPGLLGGLVDWISLGDIHFRLNLIWIAFLLAALHACYRLLGLSMRERPFLAPLPLVALAGALPIWQRSSPVDLGAPGAAAVLWTLYFSLRRDKTVALLLAGLTLAAVPGGFWFMAPVFLWSAFTWKGGPSSVVRGLSIFLIGCSLLLFSPLRGMELGPSLAQEKPWLAVSVLLGGNETPWEQGMKHLLLAGKEIRLLPWYALALVGAMMGRKKAFYPCLLLGVLLLGPPGRAALGVRMLVAMGVLAFLAGRLLAWPGFPRVPWTLFLGIASVFSLAVGWRLAASRRKDAPYWIARDVFREADRGSCVLLRRVETEFLLSGERDCSGIRGDLLRKGPAGVLFEEAVGDAADQCRGASTVRGLLFRHASKEGAPYPAASYARFRDAWLRRSRALDFHMDKPAGDLLAEPLLLVAEQLWRGREIFPALEELKLATSLAPTSSRVRLVYARALSSAGNDMEAFRQRHLAYQYAPDDPEAIRRYALHLSRIRAHHQAIPLLQEARRAFPGDETVITALGNSFVATGLPLEALDLYKKALKADPNNPYIHYNLGLLLFDRGQYREAADHASKAVKEGFNRDRSHYLMAKTSLKLGDDDAAMDHLERAVKLDPTGRIAMTARQDEVFQPLRMYSRFERITSPGPFSSEGRTEPSP